MSTPSGTLSVGSIFITNDSLTLGQISDVNVTGQPEVGQTLVYKDNSIDSSFTTGFHAIKIETNDLGGVDTTNAIQNDVLCYNVTTEDPTYADGWFPKDVGSIFTSLESTVDSIVRLNTSIIMAEDGDAARTDMVLFSDGESSTGGPTCSIGSNGDNNMVSKKEPSDGSFSFIQTMSQGERLDLTIPIGTILRSSKGIYGFSGPLVTPLGPQNFSFSQNQFYVSSTSTLTVVSKGTQVTVSLFSGDQTTLLSGPTSIAEYETQNFTCPSSGEYFVSSTGPVCASVNENDQNIRPLVPMTTELITRNSGCLVSALNATTTVTWYRRTGVSGTITVSPGTAVALGAGANANLADNGWVKVTADKPISTFSSTDGTGTQSISGFPMNQLAQLFCNPSFIGTSTTYGEAGISIASPYEGTATVYTSTGAILDTFTYVRSVAVTTSSDQQYPAGGRWKPSDVDVSTTWDGGYVTTTTPAVCIMNSSDDSVWNSSGQEMFIVGSTPEDIKADIKQVDGIWRLRTLSSTGTVTFPIC